MRSLPFLSFLGLAVALCPPTVSAESINIDFGEIFGVL